MCGIYFYANRGDAHMREFWRGFYKLQHRGYDSTGVAVLTPRGGGLFRSVGCPSPAGTRHDRSRSPMDDLRDHITTAFGTTLGQGREMSASIQSDSLRVGTGWEGDWILGHTRWATHGRIRFENTHPFVSHDGRFVLVHNGILTNYLEIRSILDQDRPDADSVCDGQTDSEVLVHLIAMAHEDGTILDRLPRIDASGEDDTIIDRILSRVRGMFALIVVDTRHQRLYAARRNAPLVIQIEHDRIQIASEMDALAPLRCEGEGERWEIPEGKAVEIDRSSFYPVVGGGGCRDDRHATEETSAPDDAEEVQSMGWITVREILHQSLLWPQAIHGPSPSQGVVDETAHGARVRCDHLILIGCGSSYWAAQMAMPWIRRMRPQGRCPRIIECIRGFEFHPEDHLPPLSATLQERITIVMLTQSGETHDILRCLTALEECVRDGRCTKPEILVLTNVGTSSASRRSVVDRTVTIQAGIERGVAATKSFTMQVLTLLNLMTDGSYRHGTDPVVIRTALETVHRRGGGENGAVHPWVSRLTAFHSVFVLSRNMALASEGALKMKELAYIHAEGYHTSALKHGPFALLDGRTACAILICTDPSVEEEDWSAYQEMAARDTLVFCICTESHRLFRAHVAIENHLVIDREGVHGVFVELMAIVHLQWLACRLALDRGLNPDFPRNLAKTVTVL